MHVENGSILLMISKLTVNNAIKNICSEFKIN